MSEVAELRLIPDSVGQEHEFLTTDTLPLQKRQDPRTRNSYCNRGDRLKNYQPGQSRAFRGQGTNIYRDTSNHPSPSGKQNRVEDMGGKE